MPYSIYIIYVRNVHVHIVWYKATALPLFNKLTSRIIDKSRRINLQIIHAHF